MKKLQSIRDHLAEHVEWLRQNPSALSVFVVNGNFGGAMSDDATAFELGYNYTARILLIEFAGDMEEVSAIVWSWILSNQPDIAQNAQRRSNLRFEVELLDNAKADVQIDIPMTDSVGFEAREGGGFIATPRTDPVADPVISTAGWSFVVDDETTGAS